MTSEADAYVSPGSTGSQTTQAINTTTDTIPPVPSDPIIPCVPQSYLQSVVGDNPNCVVSADPFPSFQSIILDQEAGTGYVMETLEPAWNTDYHTLQMPVASTQTVNASFAVVAQPTMRKLLRWTVSKYGAWPKMPEADTGDPNEVLLLQKISGQSVDLMGDQETPTYTISGEYTYGYVNYDEVTKYLGVAPYINITIAETAIPDSSFVGGIATI
jgi:hypothetical protein